MAAGETAPQSSQTAKRLLSELRDYTSKSASSEDWFLRSLAPVNDGDLSRWHAVIRGVPATAYELGQWSLDIEIVDGYPRVPPKVRFRDRCCHLNIDFNSGEICLDLLSGKAWSPAYTLKEVLRSIWHLLDQPAIDSPLNVDLAALIRSEDHLGAEAMIRYCCQEFRFEDDSH